MLTQEIHTIQITKLCDLNYGRVVTDNTDEKPKRMGIYKYLSQFPKEQQRKIFDDLVEQGRVFTELTDLGLVGFVRL